MTTLREQIKAIHAKYFNKEFHENRGQLYPAMVVDLKCKFFELLADAESRDWTGSESWHCMREIAIIRHADKLIQTCSLRENTPAMEF